jgi:hypothetical protein
MGWQIRQPGKFIGFTHDINVMHLSRQGGSYQSGLVLEEAACATVNMGTQKSFGMPRGREERCRYCDPDRRILLLETQHMNLWPLQILGEVGKLRCRFATLSRVDEIWIVETMSTRAEAILISGSSTTKKIDALGALIFAVESRFSRHRKKILKMNLKRAYVGDSRCPYSITNLPKSAYPIQCFMVTLREGSLVT